MGETPAPAPACGFIWRDGWGTHTCAFPHGHDQDPDHPYRRLLHSCVCDATLPVRVEIDPEDNGKGGMSGGCERR